MTQASPLLNLRTKAGLTMAQLAGLSGLSCATICRIEVGQRGMSLQTAVRLARALKVKPTVFIDVSALDPSK